MKIDLTEVLSIESQPSHELRIFMAAVMYSKIGIQILPVVPGGKSLPEKSTGINYGTASCRLATIKKWFDPEDGVFAGYNIGIATGKSGGVFALDVDAKEDKNGFTALAAYTDKHGAIAGPVADTPGGGRHFLMLWQDNASSSSSKVANGIDTRGGSADKCTGHIVAWPSMIDGKMYRWIRGGSIEEIPPWIMDCLGASWKPSPQKESYATEERIPEKQMARMLAFIDIDAVSYDEWLKIGMAIKTQYASKVGLDIWNNWSKNGERYKNDECYIRWNGLDEDGMVRVGTIFYMASRSGWIPETGDVLPVTSSTSIEMAIASMNVEYAVTCIGKSVRIIKEMNLSTLDPHARMDGEYDSHKIISVEDFKVISATQKVEVWVGDQLKLKSLGDVWLSHPARREYMHGTGFYPSGKVPAGKYNMWQGFSVDPVEGVPGYYLEHIRNVICDGNQQLFDWVVDWMADAVQDAARPKGCSVILRGKEGCGKGIWADTFGRLFGKHYRHLLDIGHLVGNFNAHMAGAALIFADEVFWPGNRQAANKFKGIVSEKKIQVERKGMDVEGMDNIAHVIVASNEDWVVPAGPNSRRWLVLECSDKKVGDKDYFNALAGEMGIEGMGKLLHFLQNRKIKSDLTKAPITDSLMEQRILEGEAHDSSFVWLRERLEFGFFKTPDIIQTAGDDTGWPVAVSSLEIYQEYLDWARERGYKGREIRTPQLFKRTVETYGFQKSRTKTVGTYRVPALSDIRNKLMVEGAENDQSIK